LNSPEAVERFRKAAKAFTTRSIKSQAATRKVLVDEGIYTKSGKLTKRCS
jgi:transposase-like protein